MVLRRNIFKMTECIVNALMFWFLSLLFIFFFKYEKSLESLGKNPKKTFFVVLFVAICIFLFILFFLQN